MQNPWLLLTPTNREAIRSYCVSSILALQSTIQTALAIGYGLGLCSTPQAAWTYFSNPPVWFAVLLGVFGGVGPYYRARQGFTNTSKILPASTEGK